MKSYTEIAQYFEKHFLVAPDIDAHAPGRVNLIGDHTDYNEGFVLPAAINFGTNVVASKRTDDIISIIACDIDFQKTCFSLDAIEFDDEYPWSNYVRGVLKMLKNEYPQINGANIMVSGNVPQGAGLSSSASFEIAVIKAIADIYHLPIDGIKAALVGQKAENEFVGCNCGIMDQLISALGSDNHAMLLDCRDLSFQNAPIPHGYSIFVVNSNVKRGLVDSEYNDRRKQCELGADFFQRIALRDVTMQELQQAEGKLDPVLYRRARHVISENQRTQEAFECLLANNVTRFGELMRQSHASLKDDFEVTTPELNFLAEMLNDQLGERGGARMTGGGFGGCVVALVPENMVKQLSSLVTERYAEQFNLDAHIYECQVVKGAFN